MPPDPPPFSESSLRYMATTPRERRRSLGQYFTPRALRSALLDGLELPARPRILDPACGTGEFLRDARERWPDAELEGWEVDPELAGIAAREVESARIVHCDALDQPFRPDFDAVIGNPPYFEFKPDAARRKRYARAISGRPNAYALFLLLGVEVLRDGGRLAFVVPPSMNNGAFFRALRGYLLEQGAVERLWVQQEAELFQDALQAVMLFRYQKGAEDLGTHVFRRGPHAIFCEDPASLERLFHGASTLAELGYEVRTGTVVWNQARHLLCEEAPDAVRLVWSHDIGADGRIVFQNRPGKPPFVRGRTPLHGPAIVVNRVTGTGRDAQLRAALVPEGMPFVGENHVNVVLPTALRTQREVEAVLERLRTAEALDAVRRVTGNTQVSSVELAHLVPLPALDRARRSGAPRAGESVTSRESRVSNPLRPPSEARG